MYRLNRSLGLNGRIRPAGTVVKVQAVKKEMLPAMPPRVTHYRVENTWLPARVISKD